MSTLSNTFNQTLSIFVHSLSRSLSPLINPQWIFISHLLDTSHCPWPAASLLCFLFVPHFIKSPQYCFYFLKILLCFSAICLYPHCSTETSLESLLLSLCQMQDRDSWTSTRKQDLRKTPSLSVASMTVHFICSLTPRTSLSLRCQHFL